MAWAVLALLYIGIRLMADAGARQYAEEEVRAAIAREKRRNHRKNRLTDEDDIKARVDEMLSGYRQLQAAREKAEKEAGRRGQAGEGGAGASGCPPA